MISGRGEKAFVAAEYLGSSDLRASIYLLMDERFCLAGDLGAAVAFTSSPQAKNENFFGVLVESKSSPGRFYRTFKYQHGGYVLDVCRVRSKGARLRECTESERWSSNASKRAPEQGRRPRHIDF